MRRLLGEAAVTAAGVGGLVFSSMAAYVVIDVLANSWRDDRAVAYALPAIGGVADQWGLRVVVFTVVVFLSLLVLFRRQPRTAAVVLWALATSAAGTAVIAVMVAAEIGLDAGLADRDYATAHLVAVSVTTSSRLLIVATPIVLVGSLLLRAWRSARGLTEAPEPL